jgi:hypothetical protein
MREPDDGAGKWHRTSKSVSRLQHHISAFAPADLTDPTPQLQ